MMKAVESGVTTGSGGAVQRNQQQQRPIPASSHALGPGRVDLLSKWHSAIAEEQKSTSLAVSGDSKTASGGVTSVFGDGWKSPDPAAASFFDSGSTSQRQHQQMALTSLADVNGVPLPQDLSQPHYVAKRRFSAPVSDPSFFDRADAAAGKDGVPLTNSPVVVAKDLARSNNGSALTVDGDGAGSSTVTSRDIVDALAQPHTRLFEVVMLRDPLVFSTKLRKEIYADDAAAKDIGRGKAIRDMTHARLFFDENNGDDGGNGAASSAPSVGPRVVSRGVGLSYGAARTAAAMSFLESAVADLARY
jgi:hypothetical protein